MDYLGFPPSDYLEGVERWLTQDDLKRDIGVLRCELRHLLNYRRFNNVTFTNVVNLWEKIDSMGESESVALTDDQRSRLNACLAVRRARPAILAPTPIRGEPSTATWLRGDYSRLPSRSRSPLLKHANTWPRRIGSPDPFN